MRIMSLFGLICSLSSLALSGCGGANGVGCDFREVKDGLNNGPEPRCQERTGFQALSFGPACAALNAKVVDGGCSRDGIVFGCRIGAEVTDWYYAPKTRDNAASECGSKTVLDPP